MVQKIIFKYYCGKFLLNKVNMSKKSFETVSNFKLSSVKNVLKYIHHAKRGAIAVFVEEASLNFPTKVKNSKKKICIFFSKPL